MGYTPAEARRVSVGDWLVLYQADQERQRDVGRQIAMLRNDVRGATGNDPVDIEGIYGDPSLVDAHSSSPTPTSTDHEALKGRWASWFTSDATC